MSTLSLATPLLRFTVHEEATSGDRTYYSWTIEHFSFDERHWTIYDHGDLDNGHALWMEPIGSLQAILVTLVRKFIEFGEAIERGEQSSDILNTFASTLAYLARTNVEQLTELLARL